MFVSLIGIMKSRHSRRALPIQRSQIAFGWGALRGVFNTVSPNVFGSFRWRLDLFRCESAILRTYWVLVVMDQSTRRIVAFAVPRGVVDGLALCRMFNGAIHAQTLPKYLSSDNDPLYRFHQWQANLRVLMVQEIKTVPYVPLSHPFVERLIGTVRREHLDQTLFWTAADLEEKLRGFQDYFNKHRVHSGLKGQLPDPQNAGAPLNFASYRWQKHCRGLYQTPIAS